MKKPVGRALTALLEFAHDNRGATREQFDRICDRLVRVESGNLNRYLTLLGTIGSISPPAVTTYIEEDTRNLFQNGRAVFLRNWPYVWTLMKETPLGAEGRVGMAPVVHAPGRESAATLGGWGFAISRFTRDPEAAWQLVNFLTGPEQLRKVQLRMGRVPSRKSLVPPEFVPVLEAARMRPPIPEYAQASDILQRWLSAALTESATPLRALNEAARETRLLLGEARQ